jgi:hypothetical protein
VLVERVVLIPEVLPKVFLVQILFWLPLLLREVVAAVAGMVLMKQSWWALTVVQAAAVLEQAFLAQMLEAQETRQAHPRLKEIMVEQVWLLAAAPLEQVVVVLMRQEQTVQVLKQGTVVVALHLQ